jgi:MtN3 and saliva related transmembrane protein
MPIRTGGVAGAASMASLRWVLGTEFLPPQSLHPNVQGRWVRTSMLSTVDVVGYSGTVVGTLVMMPQVIRTWRTRRANDVSFWMLTLYFLNCALWLSYGLMISAKPVIVCNGISLGISAAQLCMKVAFGSRR